jgi:pyruvate/2-oxoglutarate dehydrogenase complex dihydrolipoamide acyltransferase (E2) component
MTMTEGTVAEWRVADGAEVAAGQSIYRLETEKIEFEVEAESAGIVRHLVPAGPTRTGLWCHISPLAKEPAGAPALRRGWEPARPGLSLWRLLPWRCRGGRLRPSPGARKGGRAAIEVLVAPAPTAASLRRTPAAKAAPPP